MRRICFFEKYAIARDATPFEKDTQARDATLFWRRAPSSVNKWTIYQSELISMVGSWFVIPLTNLSRVSFCQKIRKQQRYFLETLLLVRTFTYIVKGTRTQDFSKLKTTKSHMIQFGFGENFGKIGYNGFVNWNHIQHFLHFNKGSRWLNRGQKLITLSLYHDWTE